MATKAGKFLRNLVKIIVPGANTITNVASEAGGVGKIDPDKIKQDLGLDLIKVAVLIILILALTGVISWEDADQAKEFLNT